MNTLLSMIRYEVRIQWRRRGLKVMTIAYGLVMLVFLVSYSVQVSSSAALNVGRDALGRSTGTLAMLFGTWIVTSSLTVFLLPIVLADVIPYDKQTGVDELLQSTPISYTQYLLGKSLGASAALMLGVIGVLLAVAVPWWVLSGPYAISTFLAMTFLAVPALVLINTMPLVLAAAGQPNAIRGLLIGIGILLVLPIVVGLGHDNIVAFLLPARQPMLGLYGVGTTTEFTLFGQPTAGAPAFIANFAVGLVEIAVLFGVIVGWRQLKENSA